VDADADAPEQFPMSTSFVRGTAMSANICRLRQRARVVLWSRRFRGRGKGGGYLRSLKMSSVSCDLYAVTFQFTTPNSSFWKEKQTQGYVSCS